MINIKSVLFASVALVAVAYCIPIEELRKQPAMNYLEHRDGKNQYDLEYETAEGMKIRERGELRAGPNNTVYMAKSGTTTWTDDKGMTFVTHWSSDMGGFKAHGDHLPTPPPAQKNDM